MQTAASVQTGRSSLALRVRREGDRTTIDGIRHPGFQRHASSVHGARAVIMEALGQGIGYDELVGYDSLAFRVQLMAFCPSSPHSCCGYNCAGRSVAAMPWEARHCHLANLKADNPEHAKRIREVHQQVMDSIDRGVPVEYGDIEDGVVIGYQAGGVEWVCLHPMHDNAQKPRIQKDLAWGVMIFTGPKKARPDLTALARQSLEQAVTMWNTPRAGDKGGYYLGEAAWSLWIQRLSDPMDEKQASQSQQGNAWTYDATTSYRRSAVAYLGKIAPMLSPQASAHLACAASLYDTMANQVLVDRDHCITTIAPYPWMSPWTAQQRADQARRMKQAMELDRQAIGEIEAAPRGDVTESSEKQEQCMTRQPQQKEEGMQIARRQFLTAASAAGAGMLMPRLLVAQPATQASAKLLHGFGPLQPRATKPCSLMGCMEQVLRFLGDDYDFVDLMGLSGAAFRIKIGFPTTPALMGGRIHPGISTDASIGPYLNQLAAITGRAFETDGLFMYNMNKAPAMERIRRAIDSSLPIIALNMCNDSIWGIIVGYDPQRLREDKVASDGLLVRTYLDKDPAQPSRARHFPWNLLIPIPRRDVSRQGAVQRALTNAVADFQTSERTISGPTGWFWNWKPQYRNGSAAYDAWIGDLADDEAVAALPAEQYTNYWQGTAWMYDVLHNARSAASAFLARYADGFQGNARDALKQASKTFGGMANYMEEHWGSFPYRQGGYAQPSTGGLITTEQEERNGRAFPTLADQWTPAMRSDAVDVLRCLKQFDEAAFGHLKSAGR